jgi:hypothetical protein
MDVQATTPITTLPPLPVTLPGASQPSDPKSSASGSAAGTATVPVVSGTDPGSSSNGNAIGANLIGPTPGLAVLPAKGSGADKDASATIASGIAKLYNAQEANVSVSFEIEQDPNEIVTVFTDKQTGKVIVQFPSETLVALAKFFDKLDGSVVNKKV